jgi:acetyltransferase-like isoleucine patch superfamily enzyme
MLGCSEHGCRIVPAVHASRAIGPDGDEELQLSERLRREHTPDELAELYDECVHGDAPQDRNRRRALLRAMTRSWGHGVEIGPGVRFRHPQTFEIGSNVFIGMYSYLQGWHSGRFVIGDHVWIGPHSYFDARELVIEDHVGWGPGAKVLCSMHTGDPITRPIIETDLQIRPVRIEAWADIGVNAVIMPGVTVGRASIVGAGAVVTKDVPPYAVVAGVPALVIRYRCEDDRTAQQVEAERDGDQIRSGQPVERVSI